MNERMPPPGRVLVCALDAEISLKQLSPNGLLQRSRETLLNDDEWSRETSRSTHFCVKQ